MKTRQILLAAALLAATAACRKTQLAAPGNGQQSAEAEVSGQLVPAGSSEQPAPAEFYDTKASNAALSSDRAGAPAATAPSSSSVPVLYELPAPLSDRPEQILRRKGYTVSYNAKSKTANWVAWHLTKAHTSGRNQRSEEQFTEDTDVAAPRATDQDYYNSRYDRGHLCPAGDNKWDAQAMTESFLFTNICPQNHGLNKYEWNDLEMLCRDWARRYGAVDIVCGPLYSGADFASSGSRTPAADRKVIGRNRVWVPNRLFKVVLCRKPKPKAIAFIYNNAGKKQPMGDAVCTVDDVERLTGIDFFPALDDRVEQRIEAEADLSDW